VHSLHFRAETRRESEIRTDASHLPSREARAEQGPGCGGWAGSLTQAA
jgi:hypothetical protein